MKSKPKGARYRDLKPRLLLGLSGVCMYMTWVYLFGPLGRLGRTALALAFLLASAVVWFVATRMFKRKKMR